MSPHSTPTHVINLLATVSLYSTDRRRFIVQRHSHLSVGVEISKTTMFAEHPSFCIIIMIDHRYQSLIRMFWDQPPGTKGLLCIQAPKGYCAFRHQRVKFQVPQFSLPNVFPRFRVDSDNLVNSYLLN